MTEIAHGIQSAKIETKDIWAINPEALHGERLTEKSYVEFDVAVTVNESSTNEKDGRRAFKAEIEVFGTKFGGELGGGLGAKKETSSQNVSRVTFKVPVYMNAHYRGDKNIEAEAEHFALIKDGSPIVEMD
ncbi:hypothetical protein [Mesorhizobium sp. B1-1-8]|uniref:hypothetical protein n=1 Tax=Mesorhizobium sp. B1-1-8 TaxID=2589976 RepID=UPI0011292149|nr:hypothetical protein [Mesorhizobium sp. B1-1-8]UCI05391.1 hypothetical protein FJ974_16185 [Mesorhizobium sp. B1-1-8]